MKEFDPEALAEFDGKDGKPVYIAHQGRVFDVSESKLWKGGVHMRRHHAGKDLTTDIGGAPHTPEVLERYPQVGVVRKQEAPERPMPEPLSRLLRRFPMLARHPHPMTVHFPIAFTFAAVVFPLLYLLTGIKSFEIAGLHCLGAAICFTPLVMLTGLFTWWLNYMAKPIQPVLIKIWASTALLIVSVVVFTLRILNPDILDTFNAEGIVYVLLLLSLSVLVSVIGWFGAALTFPVGKE